MKYVKYIFLSFTLAAIAFIWYHSSMNGAESSIESGNILDYIKSFLKFIGLPIGVTEFMIRKLAHFIEFAGLGFLLICDVYLFSDKPKKYICWALFIGLFVACVDETIQLYSPGRSSKIMDVWVDFSGVMSATVVTVILIKTVFKNLLPVLKAK